MPWSAASAPLMGITPLMEYMRAHYGVNYAPNTRETVRRQSIHQFVEAGLAWHNPDDPARSVNSAKNCYQISDEALALLRTFGSPSWESQLAAHLALRPTLIERYRRERKMSLVPVALPGGALELTAGPHSELIKAILEEFVPHFARDARVVYVGDTGKKFAFFDQPLLASLGVALDAHGKMPDVVLYDSRHDWLLLIEAVTSHGPIDGKRRDELARLFAQATAAHVYVTAFPNRAEMGRHLNVLAWETEIWVADSPSHLIHFNGERYLGPYQT